MILYRDGKEVDRKKVTVKDDWKYDFGKLAAEDATGKAYVYRVKEIVPEGYEVSYSDFDIINTKQEKPSPDPQPTPKKINIQGVKTWKNDEASDRPKSITVILYRDGREVDRMEVTAKQDWKYEFSELAEVGLDGNAYAYTVKEIVPNGYEVSYNGYDIVNTKKDKPKPEPKPEPKPTTPAKPTKSSTKASGKNPYTFVGGYGLHMSAILFTGAAFIVADKKRRKK